jgi:hypothetical protein
LPLALDPLDPWQRVLLWGPERRGGSPRPPKRSRWPGERAERRGGPGFLPWQGCHPIECVDIHLKIVYQHRVIFAQDLSKMTFRRQDIRHERRRWPRACSLIKKAT